MQIAVLLVGLLLAVPALGQESPSLTYQKVLGYENVRKIVVETLDAKVRKYNESPKAKGAPDKLEYDSALPTTISERIVRSDVPPTTTAAEATKTLRQGFGRFVDGLVEFAAKNVRDPILRLNKDLYDRYMGRPQEEQKCGEIPCNRPPCCHYCEPPPCKSGGPTGAVRLAIPAEVLLHQV